MSDTPPPSPPRPEGEGSRPLILVAEDNDALRKMLNLVLVRSGYEVSEAVDGQAAVEQAGRRRPDLILLDIRMPRLNGIEALRQIRRLPGLGTVPAIMLTALSQRSEVVAAARAGACDYIIKSGFNIRAFLERIGSMLRKPPVVRDPGQERAGAVTEAFSRRAEGPRADEQGQGPRLADGTTPPPDESPPLPEPPSPGEPAEPAARPSNRACLLRDAGGMAELAERRRPVSQCNLSEQVQRIADVKALPFVMPQVLALTSSSFSSAGQLAAALEKDVAMTAKVLVIANSTLYRRGRAPVTDLRQAVRNIGFGSVRQAALGLGLMDLFNQPVARPGVDRMRHWEHAIATASIARTLAGRAGMDESQAFVVGLLHSMGRLIYDEFFPDDYAAMLVMQDGDHPVAWDLERRWMGMDHAHLAAAVMRKWDMPAELYEPIDDARLPLSALLGKPEPRRRWAALVKLSAGLAACLGFGDRRVNHLDHLDNEQVDDFGVDDAVVEELRNTVPEHLRELKMMMMVYMPPAGKEQVRMAVSDRPLLYLCTRSPHLDLFELYLRQRHRRFEAFNTVEAFANRLESAQTTVRSVVNLLPLAGGDRTVSRLDEWAGQWPKAASTDGLVLARPDQVQQLVGAFGQAFDGALAPVPVCKLERLLGLRAD